MPYRVGQIECDTPEEAHALLSNRAVSKPAAKRKVSPSQRKGIAASWKAAKALAKKEGISISDARSKIAKAKG